MARQAELGSSHTQTEFGNEKKMLAPKAWSLGVSHHHVDYIHWNPVKHGWVKQVTDWPYSSFHRFVANGIYSVDWACDDKFEINAGEC